ncbi:hypothetical protein L3X38_007665 [Prunus dulcis]|uniref:Uncharacterized protein n=1 Tax=Prunus dulcis TaxID=3755 RepID=A0AAD5F6D6_PRUDU|nr:hypothetical protein L3X38_007665 [Prunus dulcis]
MSLVKTCKENLQLMRDNEFEELVEQASSFCYKHDITVPTMDEEYVIPGRSQRNAPMKKNYHRHRVKIFIHVIDGQLAELNDRFNEFSGQVSVDGIKGCDQLVLYYLQQPSSMEAIRSLEEEGLIHSTIDEFHYKSAAYA